LKNQKTQTSQAYKQAAKQNRPEGYLRAALKDRITFNSTQIEMCVFELGKDILEGKTSPVDIHVIETSSHLREEDSDSEPGEDVGADVEKDRILKSIDVLDRLIDEETKKMNVKRLVFLCLMTGARFVELLVNPVARFLDVKGDPSQFMQWGFAKKRNIKKFDDPKFNLEDRRDSVYRPLPHVPKTNAELPEHWSVDEIIAMIQTVRETELIPNKIKKNTLGGFAHVIRRTRNRVIAYILKYINRKYWPVQNQSHITVTNGREMKTHALRKLYFNWMYLLFGQRSTRNSYLVSIAGWKLESAAATALHYTIFNVIASITTLSTPGPDTESNRMTTDLKTLQAFVETQINEKIKSTLETEPLDAAYSAPPTVVTRYSPDVKIYVYRRNRGSFLAQVNEARNRSCDVFVYRGREIDLYLDSPRTWAERQQRIRLTMSKLPRLLHNPYNIGALTRIGYRTVKSALSLLKAQEVDAA
jgi:hypothetical protein